MNFHFNRSPAKCEEPSENEIAALASKFYEDSHFQDGHDRDNWLCAKYMLTQKHLIQCQISSLHNREIAWSNMNFAQHSPFSDFAQMT